MRVGYDMTPLFRGVICIRSALDGFDVYTTQIYYVLIPARQDSVVFLEIMILQQLLLFLVILSIECILLRSKI